ncbi:hypothetical protein QUB05_26420 [Microcoleus sp. F10-C6]|uniref:hypothetical protein n=1 Tax=unclassified Microcoleus TaxID=2642155 RepID=UPI002FD72402
MTNGWCRSNYHKDGKRRWGSLTNGLCCECECETKTGKQQVGDDKGKIIRLQQKIVDLEQERDRLDKEVDHALAPNCKLSSNH